MLTSAGTSSDIWLVQSSIILSEDTTAFLGIGRGHLDKFWKGKIMFIFAMPQEFIYSSVQNNKGVG